jgi:hypothetical protein
MFEASVDGRPYDTKWAAYYKPWGLNIEGGGAAHSDDDSSSYVAPARVSAPVATTTIRSEEPAEATDVQVPATSEKANDILALIRSRQSKTA